MRATTTTVTGSCSTSLRLRRSQSFFGSSGFRRPGYVISAEPGVNYRFKSFTAFVTVPVALERNRTKSYSDKLITVADGTDVHGDAAFADYSINV